MKAYIDLIKHVLEHGKQRTDRTGTGTLSVFGTQTRYDLRHGFPLLTTKKVLFSAVVRELLWFLRGSTNINDDLTEHTPIWDAWAAEDGSLSSIYGAQWRRLEVFGNESALVPIRVGAPPRVVPLVCKDLVDLRPNIRKGQIRDPFARNCHGVGYLGTITQRPSYYNRAYNLWGNMLARCYNEQHPHFELYGGKGVYVDAEWHCFATFLRDITNLPFFEAWKRGEDYALDKDYYASACYGAHTALFLHRKENKTYAGNVPITVNGELFVTIKDGAEAFGLDSRRVSERLRGLRRYPELDIKRYTPPDGYVVRYRRVVDQIAQALEQIQKTPDSRRIIVSAWNVEDVPKMALPPCHLLFQFYVEPPPVFPMRYIGADLCESEERHNEKVDRATLHCQLYQRSADLALGVPFNIASYALLLTMMAQHCDLEPGMLVHTIGDAHIYLNHVDGLKRQIEREPFPLPRLRVTKKELDLVTFEDITVEGYEHHPFIRYQVAV